MGTLYLDHKSASVERTGPVLTVRNGLSTQRIPLSLLDRVVVCAEIALPMSLLVALAESGVTTTLIGRRQRFAHVLPHGPGDVLRLIAQVHCFENLALKLRLAAWMVRRKLRAHQRFLARLLAARPDQRLTLTKTRQRLTERMRAIATATTIDELRGIEGAAARDYFEGYGVMLPPEMGFTGRNRRPPKDPANALLSLAYTLLHSEAVGALAAAGLEPRLGFLHDPAWGRASLAADLVEGWRASVDEMVWQLCRDRLLRADHFASQDGAVLLGKSGRGIFFPAFESLMRTQRPPLRRFARLLAAVLPRLLAQSRLAT